MQEEIWRGVIGYETTHMVSNLGRVKSLDRYVNGKHDKRILKGRILKPDNTSSYSRVRLANASRHLVHRLVAMAFIGEDKSKPVINHIDNNPLNNNVTNLEWCTQKENIRHSMVYGRRGYAQNVKLSKSQIMLVREMRDYSKTFPVRTQPFTCQWISKAFKVHESTVAYIANRKRWANIE